MSALICAVTLVQAVIVVVAFVDSAAVHVAAIVVVNKVVAIAVDVVAIIAVVVAAFVVNVVVFDQQINQRLKGLLISGIQVNAGKAERKLTSSSAII